LLRVVICDCETFCCVERAESWVVRSESWACRVARAFCVAERSTRRVERRLEAAAVGSASLLPLVGVPVLSFEVGIWDDCGLGEAGLEAGCGCWRDSCAVRSARAVSIISS
jgi:hypothetical protein